MTSPRRPDTHRYGDENRHLTDCWRPYTNRWECWCGRRLGCPAALDAHQYDHESRCV